MARTVSPSAQQPRDPSNKALDIETVRAIAQAAVDVELFTIPLYMTSLYSIEGYHQIGVGGSALYEGRQWPGAGTTAQPDTANERAFNILFSIFIQEMLHLQMAANMASGIGVTPCFTSSALQNEGRGWTCYGPENRIIPHIIDLADTKADHMRVNIGPLDAERCELFLAIEQPEDRAKAAIKPDRMHKYFPKVPFARCSPYEPLPLFGTIGHMYQCYYDYLHLSYTDGTQLWQSFFPVGIQRDLFNGAGRPKEYPGVGLALDPLGQMLDMMDAITDQGEGNILQRRPAMLAAVMPKFQPSLDAMTQNNPTYSDKGELQPESADANARYENDSLDHFERFELLRGMLPEITTWATAGRTGKWTHADFEADDYDPNRNPYNLPSTEDIAAAMNKIADDPDGHYFTLMSQAAVGAIAGVTTVLNDYWKNPSAGFPFPAMGGTKDRMSAAWAAFGRTPDLSLGLEPLPQGTLGHACQGLDFNSDGANTSCAQVQVYHSCIGSNSCRAQGGCGFVNTVNGGGGSCGGSCGGKTSSGSGDAGGGTSGGTCRALKANAGAPGPRPQAMGCGRTGDVRPPAGKVLCGAPPAPANCGAPTPPPSPAGGCGAPTPAPSPGTCGAPTPAPSPGTCGAPTPAPSPGTCGGPTPPVSKTLYSAPGDNKCGGFGGCAVPIAASQLYPKLKDGSTAGTMQVFDFQESAPGAGDWHSVPIDTLPFKEGDNVGDIAYQAFVKVMEHRGKTPPAKPEPSLLRLVFPPST